MSLALIPSVPARPVPADLAAAAAANEATWGEAMRRLCALRFADALELWVDDPCVRLVGAAPGAPSVVRGRAALLATWQGLGAAVRHAAYHQLAFHQTVDPEVAFVERRTDLTLRSGPVVSMSALDRVRFRGGRIAELTETCAPASTSASSAPCTTWRGWPARPAAAPGSPARCRATATAPGRPAAVRAPGLGPALHLGRAGQRVEPVGAPHRVADPEVARATTSGRPSWASRNTCAVHVPMPLTATSSATIASSSSSSRRSSSSSPSRTCSARERR